MHLVFPNKSYYFKLSKFIFDYIIMKIFLKITISNLKERKLHMGTTYSRYVNFCKIARKNFFFCL